MATKLIVRMIRAGETDRLLAHHLLKAERGLKRLALRRRGNRVACDKIEHLLDLIADEFRVRSY